jgi:quinol monooxygenase YgiN
MVFLQVSAPGLFDPNGGLQGTVMTQGGSTERSVPWLDHPSSFEGIGKLHCQRAGVPSCFHLVNSKTLTVVAIAKAKPGQEEALKKELLALTAPTRREAGCINYDLHQDIENSTRFVFHENWESRSHLEAHLASPHMRSFGGKVAALLAEPVEIILAGKVG